MSDPWEDLRHMTIDQLITSTKLAYSSVLLNGHTTPEGWPFVVIVAVAKPGSERAIEYAREYHEKVQAATQWHQQAVRQSNPQSEKDNQP